MERGGGDEHEVPQWRGPGAQMPLVPGDILIQGRGHAAMWVGGPKPLVHSVTTAADGAGHTKGAIRQSVSYLRQFDANGLRVFRFAADGALGVKAAAFAIRWATESDPHGAPPADPFTVGGNATVRVLRTPYSERRHLRPVKKPARQEEWSVKSLFRVIKAIARERDGMGLSPNHGVSCDQFVMYCYQAAALEAYLTSAAIPIDLIATIRRDADAQRARPFDLLTWARTDDYVGSSKTPLADRHFDGKLWRDRAYAVQRKVFRSLKPGPDLELITRALTAIVDPAAAILPKPLRRDAKTNEIESFIRDLRAADSGFRELGRTKETPRGDFVIEPP